MEQKEFIEQYVLSKICKLESTMFISKERINESTIVYFKEAEISWKKLNEMLSLHEIK